MQHIKLSAAAVLCVVLFVFWIYLSESDLTTVKLKTSSLSADYYKLLFSSLLYIAAGQMRVVASDYSSVPLTVEGKMYCFHWFVNTKPNSYDF